MSEILISEFTTGLLVFLRVTGFLFTAPLYKNNEMPNLPKFLFGIMLTYIIVHFAGDYKFDFNGGLILLILTGLKEIFVGIIIGFFLMFVFHGVSFAGTLIGFDMGLSMSQAFDPTTESSTDVIGQILSMSSLLIFIIINGHHYIIQGLAYSFEVIPIGFFQINDQLFQLMIKYTSTMFLIAVQIASPIIVVFFLLHIGSGIISRIAPQMNVFFVIQPLKLGMGFGLLIFLAPIYVYLIRTLLEGYEKKLFELIRAMAA